MNTRGIGGAALALVLALAGCGTDWGSHADALKDRMCACADPACAGGVDQDWQALDKQLEAKYPHKADVPANLAKHVGEARDATDACRGKLWVATMNKLKDRMCACTNQPCTDAIEKDWNGLGKQLMAPGPDHKEPPADVEASALASWKAYKACRTKALAVGASATASKLKDRMCACTDPACAHEVETAWDAFTKDVEKKVAHPEDAPADLIKAMRDTEMAYLACRAKVTDGAAPGGATPGGAAPGGAAPGGAAPGGADHPAATATALRDRMCACHDQGCLDAVEKDSNAFRDALRAKYAALPPDLMKALGPTHKAFVACRRALRAKLGSGAP